MFIRQEGRKTSYRYDITGHAIEDQLYLFGHVVPRVRSAYGLSRPSFYLNREITWISVRYESKPVALFKRDILGLPNGRKTNATIPKVILDNASLMRCLVKEILATDGVLGFYSAGQNYPHKYARIQIKMSSGRLVREIATFLIEQIGLSVSYRVNSRLDDGWAVRPRHILQINRSEDIDVWRKEIGFSNPSHISRLMLFERLGECPPRTSITGRLSFLAGCSSKMVSSRTIAREAFVSLMDEMKRRFGSPELSGQTIVEELTRVNLRLRARLGRNLPKIVD